VFVKKRYVSEYFFKKRSHIRKRIGKNSVEVVSKPQITPKDPPEAEEDLRKRGIHGSM
jgi:hypothetical protein